MSPLKSRTRTGALVSSMTPAIFRGEYQVGLSGVDPADNVPMAEVEFAIEDDGEAVVGLDAEDGAIALVGIVALREAAAVALEGC